MALISLMENAQTKRCPKVVTSILDRLGADSLSLPLFLPEMLRKSPSVQQLNLRVYMPNI